MMSSFFFYFQHTLNRLFDNCVKLYWYYISSSWNILEVLRVSTIKIRLLVVRESIEKEWRSNSVNKLQLQLIHHCCTLTSRAHLCRVWFTVTPVCRNMQVATVNNRLHLVHPVQVIPWPSNFAPGIKTKFKDFSMEI